MFPQKLFRPNPNMGRGGTPNFAQRMSPGIRNRIMGGSPPQQTARPAGMPLPQAPNMLESQGGGGGGDQSAQIADMMKMVQGMFSDKGGGGDPSTLGGNAPGTPFFPGATDIGGPSPAPAPAPSPMQSFNPNMTGAADIGGPSPAPAPAPAPMANLTDSTGGGGIMEMLSTQGPEFMQGLTLR